MMSHSRLYDEKWVRLYTILADSDTMHELEYALQENDEYLVSNGYTLHYLFKPMIQDFAKYKEIDMTGKPGINNGPNVHGNENGQSQFNQSSQLTYN